MECVYVMYRDNWRVLLIYRGFGYFFYIGGNDFFGLCEIYF